MYRYRTLNKFTLNVQDNYINNPGFEGFRKIAVKMTGWRFPVVMKNIEK